MSYPTLNSGFQLKLAADTTTRFANIYLGSSNAKGIFTASLSDNSAPDFVVELDSGINVSDFSLVSLNYSAALPGQELLITFISKQIHSAGGYVSLQAVTLDALDSPPVLSLIHDQSVNEGGVLSFTVTANDPNGQIPVLSATGLPVDATLDPASVVISSIPTNGTTVANVDGTVTYTPHSGYFGTDSFT
ncbi:MAG: hypothetical protein GXP08_05685 [Gammaproteobacteria bacterium]|nr:hypothetical protein [Gammaproteobacteria bacterium]